jgi:hypothetical protein
MRHPSADHELQALLAKRCAQFGTVKFVRLLPIAKNEVHRFSFVQYVSPAPGKHTIWGLRSAS